MPGGSHRDPEEPAAHVSDCLALLPSGPDAVRRLRLHRVRAAVRPADSSVYLAASAAGKHGRRPSVDGSDHKMATARRGRPTLMLERVPPSVVVFFAALAIALTPASSDGQGEPQAKPRPLRVMS